MWVGVLPDRPKVWVKGPSVSVGRSNDNDVAFPTDKCISRKHTHLEVADGSLTVVDLKSKFGNYIIESGKKVRLPEQYTINPPTNLSARVSFGYAETSYMELTRERWKFCITRLQKEDRITLKRLSKIIGATLTEDVREATHLIMNKFSATIKLLLAIVLKKPVITLDYLSFIDTQKSLVEIPPPESFFPLTDRVSDVNASRGRLLVDTIVCLIYPVDLQYEDLLRLCGAEVKNLVESDKNGQPTELTNEAVIFELKRIIQDPSQASKTICFFKDERTPTDMTEVHLLEGLPIPVLWLSAGMLATAVVSNVPTKPTEDIPNLASQRSALHSMMSQKFTQGGQSQFHSQLASPGPPEEEPPEASPGPAMRTDMDIDSRTANAVKSITSHAVARGGEICGEEVEFVGTVVRATTPQGPATNTDVYAEYSAKESSSKTTLSAGRRQSKISEHFINEENVGTGASTGTGRRDNHDCIDVTNGVADGVADDKPTDMPTTGLSKGSDRDPPASSSVSIGCEYGSRGQHTGDIEEPVRQPPVLAHSGGQMEGAEAADSSHAGRGSPDMTSNQSNIMDNPQDILRGGQESDGQAPGSSDRNPCEHSGMTSGMSIAEDGWLRTAGGDADRKRIAAENRRKMKEMAGNDGSNTVATSSRAEYGDGDGGEDESEYTPTAPCLAAGDIQEPITIEIRMSMRPLNGNGRVDSSRGNLHTHRGSTAGTKGKGRLKDVRRFMKNSIKRVAYEDRIMSTWMDRVTPKESEREIQLRLDAAMEQERETIAEEMFSDRFRGPPMKQTKLK